MSDFILKLEPSEKILFSGKLGEEAVNSNLKITNITKERQALKVKCTSNEMFRIRPPVFTLKAAEEGVIKLTFNAGKTVPENGKHYFVVYYIKAEDESKAARVCWQEHKDDPDGTKRLYVDFKDEGEGEKSDHKELESEKKEGEEGKKGEKKEGEPEKKEGEPEKKEGEPEKKEGEPEKKEGEPEKKEGEGEKKAEGEKKEGEGEKKEGEGEKKAEGEKKEGEGEKKEGEGEKKEEEKKEEGEKKEGEEKKEEKKE